MPTSIGTMIKQLAGMIHTKDLNAWENGFVQNALEQSQQGTRTSRLTDSQVEKVEQIWRKHFAG